MTEKDLLDAQEIIEIYKKTPIDKRPILTAAFNAFLAGAEAQELSNGEMAGLEHCLIEQASASLAKMTTHYCATLKRTWTPPCPAKNGWKQSSSALEP